MNVVHISTSDIGHGAGISCYRLHRQLKELGVQSRIFVTTRVSDDPDVTDLFGHPNPLIRYSQKSLALFEAFLNLTGPQHLFSVATLLLKRHPVFQQADIVHVHNIHRNHKCFSLNLLEFNQKPLVWTLHDMWPLTGHCYYSYDCEGWRRGCGKCPYPDTFVPILYDTSAFQWKIKSTIYARSNFHLVTPSTWLSGLARESKIFRDRISIQTIPYSIDTRVFKPHEQLRVRQEFGIEPGRKVISFCAASLKDKRKGFSFLTDSLIRLKDHLSDAHILVIGRAGDVSALQPHYPTTYTGYISDPDQMARAYACADIFVMPSIHDNLPNTVLENMACGIPVVAFDQGGVPDMIVHMKNGYLARLGNPDDLAQGIRSLIEDDVLRIQMKTQSLRIIQEKFSGTRQAADYIRLYERLIGAHHGQRH